ncbi:DNA-binding transcriptional regulator, LysR family [Fontimonas thermophila]|uniref:DNA-binding transcriptional regulator, LysR family n=1 Tax=Fontimonas thermophila TaxID=1076937 RepID=A0A1I2H7R9_9GAMM|nr:LysR family transcriptional regulator [Fontimonas thermophila]SFF25390.1 DNA-binding transcriptional regulator, LysR family [Fontimonas thermophila]
MELRHLRYFVAVAEARHFTRAARALGIGQPPLSQQIQALERELGLALFTRLPRGVALTEAGAAFYEDACRILRETERAVERARRVARGELGRVRMGMINSAPFHPLVPRLIREFRRAHPQVTLSLEEGTTPALAAAVRNDLIDIAFVRPLLGETQGLCIEPLLDEDLVVALPSSHPLARRVRVPLLALSIEPFVLFPRTVGAGLHDEIIRACRTAGFSPRIVQETSQVTSIVNLVAAGLGVSIVPASMQQIHGEGIAYRPIQKPVPKARLSVIYRESDRTVPHLRRLLELAHALARQVRA